MAVDYWSQAQIDPGYLAAHGSNKQSLINALVNYGDASQAFARAPGVDPATGQPYKTLAESYGFGQNDVSAAAGNPYSVQAQLAKQLSGDQYGIGNTAQAHGATFSGANAAAQAHEQQNAGQRNYNAQQQLASRIGTIQGNDQGALTSAYGTIATNALNTPTPAVAPAAAPAPAAPAYTPTPGTGPLTVPGFETQGPQNRGTGGLIPLKTPKPPTPKLGYLGHA